MKIVILSIVALGILAVILFLGGSGNIGANYALVPYEEIDLSCLDSIFEETVIRTEAEYQSLIDMSRDFHTIPSFPCTDYEFPQIDFNEKTLLAHIVRGSGCSLNVERSVLRSEIDKEVIYDIKADFVGSCDKLISEHNFILVPKIPADYKVSFRVDSE